MSKVPSAVLALFILATAGLAAPPSRVLEKKFSFPPPVQWMAGNWQVSVIGVAWGPANSPEMVSRGYEERLPNEKPGFMPDRPYALALELRGYAPNTNSSTMWGGSGWVQIKDVSGALQVPLELTPRGFVHFSGSPGVMDMSFKHTNTTEFWDFFPVSAHQKAFLFQSFAFAPAQSHRGRLRAAFRILIRQDDLALVNAMPGSQNWCSDFSRNFSGMIGPSIAVKLYLTMQGTTVSGTEQYARVGQNLWLTGRIDSLGNFILQEHYPKDHLTGIFNGTFNRACNVTSGYFSKPDGSELLPFRFDEESPAK